MYYSFYFNDILKTERGWNFLLLLQARNWFLQDKQLINGELRSFFRLRINPLWEMPLRVLKFPSWCVCFQFKYDILLKSCHSNIFRPLKTLVYKESSREKSRGIHGSMFSWVYNFLKTELQNRSTYCINGLTCVCISGRGGAEWIEVGQLVRYCSTPDWK